ncbi:MAG TPA: hypothetical protein VGH54_12140 [Mycobacterium sp.]|jgi:hypothetical protein|uniref:hypothetical protein n=1 Tax=Mycobacterium sp. TaxID=1785 RepID=UPI002F41B58A
MTDAPAVSTVPAAKVNLLEIFRNFPDLDGVTIGYGDPGIAKLEHEHIWIGDSGPENTAYAPYGQLKMQEEYVLKFAIHISKPGFTQQEATERAFALYSAIAVGLRPLLRTPTVIAKGVWSFTVSWNQFLEFVSDQGYTAYIDAQIDIKARI